MKRPHRKRTYLTRQARHESLLAAAADLVETRGWNALTMVSLARHAKVSRQLVYQHFDAVDALLMATLTQIFQDVFVRTRDVVAGDEQGDLVATVGAMQRITFEMPRGRARALWQVMSAAGTGTTHSDIADLSRQLRHLLVATVQPLVAKRLGLAPVQAGPLTWMLIVAFWGGHQLIDDGELDSDQAKATFDWLIDRVARGPSAESAGAPRPVADAPRRRRPSH